MSQQSDNDDSFMFRLHLLRLRGWITTKDIYVPSSSRRSSNPIFLSRLFFFMHPLLRLCFFLLKIFLLLFSSSLTRRRPSEPSILDIRSFISLLVFGPHQLVPQQNVRFAGKTSFVSFLWLIVSLFSSSFLVFLFHFFFVFLSFFILESYSRPPPFL